jgi:outer membrane protein assembly factor BamB
MRHFLSRPVAKVRSGAAFRSMNHPISISVPSATFARNLCLTLLVVCVAFLSSSSAQQPFPTSRGDNARSGANTNETLLTPANVNKNSFGRLFSFPIDYIAMAQPLYVPNVNIPGLGSHNVVYVVTQADSVYAIDADTGTQLWYASMLNGGTTASGKYLPCGTAGGFNQEGIVGTPVIDPATNTMYLVAKTLLNTVVRHHLHALDIATGNEQPGSPVLITATSVSNQGHVTNFNSLHQKNRPGLLLLNGILYLGFGSNYCNDANSGWVLSYDSASLSQLAVFNTSPDYGLTSIWQTGNGLAADEAGNIFVETAESAHVFDVPNGGQTYCNSVVKLAPDLTVADYFTPWTVAYLNSHDYDLSSTGALILPDQEGGPSLQGHELVAGGKQGYVYVLDRDSMGMFSPSDSQILQEFALVPNTVNDVLMSSSAYWNNNVYFAPNNSPLMAFPLSGGLLGTPLKTAQRYPGSHSPSISANGNSNGILWVIAGQLFAFDANSLQLLYGTSQAPGLRDKLPPVGHFVTQTVAAGKVYVATQNSLEAYGVFHVVSVTAGDAQTATVGTALSAPIQIQAVNPYTGQPDVGATVNFSDGGKGGLFNPPSVVIGSNGGASTTYTVPKKAGSYTLTISGIGFGNVSATATATAAAAVRMIAYGGAKQIGAAGSNLTKPIIAQAQDVYKNGVAGVTVHFTANNGAVPNPSSVVSDASGLARTTLQLPTTVATITVTGSSTGLKNISYVEYSVAGPAANIAIASGNNQSAPAGTQLPQSLTVLVTDQYGNPVPGVDVDYDDGGAGGTFSNSNPGVTGTNGTATQFYTLPPLPGTITINATVAGIDDPRVFTETGQ